MKKLFCALILAMGFHAQADVLQDFDSLGGNDVLLEKAKALQGESTVSVVQDRIVKRRNRFEISPEYGSVLGGDSYNKSTQWGLNLHYHINPRLSLGVKYAQMANELRPEGESLISDTQLLGKAYVPEIDYAKNETLGMIYWYPIYGKMNVLDTGIAHFDLYFLLGSGNIELKSGRAATNTAGTGLGIWVSQHLSTRLELRYQNYKAQSYAGEQNMDLTIGSAQVGYLF